jgi:hypothetical protein
MGQVYLYLASWVAGGVLLGAGMLLQQRTATTSDSDGTDHQRTMKRARAWTELAVFGLVGFGLAGLSCEMAAVAEPWSVVCASASGAAFVTLAQALRVR